MINNIDSQSLPGTTNCDTFAFKAWKQTSCLATHVRTECRDGGDVVAYIKDPIT
jgi:hypothetical protein